MLTLLYTKPSQIHQASDRKRSFSNPQDFLSYTGDKKLLKINLARAIPSAGRNSSAYFNAALALIRRPKPQHLLAP
jgi:hypothetical protein